MAPNTPSTGPSPGVVANAGAERERASSATNEPGPVTQARDVYYFYGPPLFFYGFFLEAHGGTWFRTPCPNCRAKPLKVLAAAPRPREKGRFRVAILDRPPSPSWDLRLPEIGTQGIGTRQVENTFYLIKLTHHEFPNFWIKINGEILQLRLGWA